MSCCGVTTNEGIGEMSLGCKAPNCMCTRIEFPTAKKKVKRKDKRKRRKIYEPPSLPETFVTYEPCVHLHFKTDLIDRDCLTHEQYLDLLATPKGYRWIGEIDCDNPELDINKVKRKKPKKPKKIETIIVKPDAGDFADEFVEDMWDVMSPDITNRLIDFLRS
uniref:Uncharacterized protein n=1 Tax=Homalodisca liturata TaxID=320908 RepID=A0A1B6K0L6_9HEMI